MALRRQEAATLLGDEEIAQLRDAEGLPNIPTDGSAQDMTEAELAILEAKGLNVQTASGFDVVNPDALKSGDTLFKVGSEAEKDIFYGKVLHPSGDKEKVWVWRRSDGVARQIPRAHILYYVEKGRISPRPIPGKTDASPPEWHCPSKLSKCKKLFFTAGDANDHMRAHHSTEFKQAQVDRELVRERQMDSLLERIAEGAAGGSQQSIDYNQLAQAVMLLAEASKGPGQPPPVPAS